MSAALEDAIFDALGSFWWLTPREKLAKRLADHVDQHLIIRRQIERQEWENLVTRTMVRPMPITASDVAKMSNYPPLKTPPKKTKKSGSRK